MKQNKRMLTMVLMLCALVAVFVVYKMADSMNDARARREAEEQAKKDAVVMIAEYNYKDTVAMRYRKRGEEEVALEVRSGRWVSVDEPLLPLDQSIVATMANALAKMGALSVVELDGADVDAFGFDDPEWTFSVTYDNDGAVSEHTYVRGNYNEFGGGYYFKEVGVDDKVYLIVETLTDYFAYDLYTMADTGTFPVLSADKLTSVDITVDGQTRNVSGETVTEAFITLTDLLKPTSFVEYQITDEILAEYALDTMDTRVSVNYTETLTVTDTAGASSSTSVDQAKTFAIVLGESFERDGEQYTPYVVDGYSFVYYMPVSVSESMLTYFAWEEPADTVSPDTEAVSDADTADTEG